MAHTAKHKKEQKDKAEKNAQKDSVKAAEKKGNQAAREQFKKFLAEIVIMNKKVFFNLWD